MPKDLMIVYQKASGNNLVADVSLISGQVGAVDAVDKFHMADVHAVGCAKSVKINIVLALGNIAFFFREQSVRQELQSRISVEHAKFMLAIKKIESAPCGVGSKPYNTFSKARGVELSLIHI